MSYVTDIAALEALHDAPAGASLTKVTPALTPAYARWIERARFAILSTVGPEGVDATPRGDDGPVVRIADARTLLMPDWRGNNRLDSLRNIVRDGRASLMFMIAGSDTVIRCNGTARLSVDAALCARFARKGGTPKCVIEFSIAEVYFQCARALLRAGLWRNGDCSDGLPTAGDFLAEITEGGFDGASYDADWPDRARGTMW